MVPRDRLYVGKSLAFTGVTISVAWIAGGWFKSWWAVVGAVVVGAIIFLYLHKNRCQECDSWWFKKNKKEKRACRKCVRPGDWEE